MRLPKNTYKMILSIREYQYQVGFLNHHNCTKCLCKFLKKKLYMTFKITEKLDKISKYVKYIDNHLIDFF